MMATRRFHSCNNTKGQQHMHWLQKGHGSTHCSSRHDDLATNRSWQDVKQHNSNRVSECCDNPATNLLLIMVCCCRDSPHSTVLHS